MYEYLRSFMTLLLPELLEPANVMFLGIVGAASGRSQRVIVASSLIVGGACVCALSFLFCLFAGNIIAPETLRSVGAGIIISLGALSIVASKGFEFEIPEDRFSDSFIQLKEAFQGSPLVVKAFLLGFGAELVQSSALLAFSMAATSNTPLVTFIGAASAHVITKSLVLLLAFGLTLALFNLFSTIVRAVDKRNRKVAEDLWISGVKRKIRAAKRVFEDQEAKARKVQFYLGILLVSFGCFELLSMLF